MKHIILLISLIILFGQSFAQKGFYLKPAVNYLKFHKNNDKGSIFNSISGSKVIVTTKNFYQSYPDILLGINFGYRATNFFYEFGYYSDVTSSNIQMKYITYDPNYNTSFETHAYSISGVTQRSYPFRLGMKILQRESKIYDQIITSLFLTSGFEIQTNYGSVYRQASQFSNSIDGVNEITIEIITERSITKRNIKPTLGLLFEVKNKNNFNLFNLTLNYNFNLKSTKWLQERIVIITDINGEKHKVGQFLSTGSGLYLGISKNIYFNRIFKRKNKNKTTANSTYQ